MKTIKKCSVEGCERKHKAKGMCALHWQRKNKGMPLDAPLNDKRGSKNPKWRGGEISDGHGRVLVYSPHHPNPSYCGTHVYRYRLVVEAAIGRHLVKGEIVHHKNGIKDDDRLENLELMTQSQHASLHFKGCKRKPFTKEHIENMRKSQIESAAKRRASCTA